MRTDDIGKVLITGSDGYIGRVLAGCLTGKGYDVQGLDTFYYEDCLFGEDGPSIPTIRKDVRELALEDLRGFDAVIHLAALSNDPLGALDPELTLEINFRASSRLAAMAKEAAVRRFLYASSCSLYGQSHQDWVDESSAVAPLTAYARSKVETEAALQKLAVPGFSPVILRCATVCGLSPKLRVDLVVNNLAAWGVTKREIRILSDGTPWRPLIHVEDLALAYEYFLQAPLDRVHNRAFNIGFNDQNYQVCQIAELVAQELQGTQVTFAAQGERDARSYRVRFDSFLELYQRQPRWNLKSSIESIVREYQKRKLGWEDFTGRKYVRLNQLHHLLNTARLDAQLRWRTV